MNSKAITVNSEIAKLPCRDCEFYRDCTISLKACHLYYNYVTGRSGAPRAVRAKTIYNAIDSDDGEYKVRAFLDTVRAAQKSMYAGIFYRPDDKRLTYAQMGNRRFSELKNDDSAQLVGFYGPEFTEQEIADFIELELEKYF